MSIASGKDSTTYISPETIQSFVVSVAQEKKLILDILRGKNGNVNISKGISN